MSTIPLDCHQISAGLTTNDLQRSLRFYVDGLGFTLGEQHEVDGTVRHAMLKAGAGELGISQDDFAKGKDRVKGVGMRLWITTTQDLHALANQVKQAGFSLDSEVAPLPWGPVGFAVTDPDGFKLTVSNPG